MQISQVSQGFVQAATWMQGLHLVGSPRVSRLHEPTFLGSSEPSHTRLPLPAGSSQHPKQSQPFGVSGPQYEPHVADCAACADVHVYPANVVLASYLHWLGSGA